MKKLVLSVVLSGVLGSPALAEPVSGQGTWETTLLARDVDNDGTVDAYYDTTLDITWSADPYFGRTVSSDFLVSYGGRKVKESFKGFGQQRAAEWVDYLNSTRYLGVNQWRLPRFVDVDRDGCTRGVDCGQYHDVTLSEAAHLYAVTLGNLPNCGPPRGTCPQEGGGLTNTGPFGNTDERFPQSTLPSAWIEDPEVRGQPLWKFGFKTGLQKPEDEGRGAAQVWAVLDGDIADYERRAPGPEPEVGDYAQLHCPGDVDLNSVADVVAVTAGGRAIIRSLDGAASMRFALDHARDFVDSAVIADTDGNGAPELVALGASVAEVRDLQQGETRSVVNFWSPIPAAKLFILDDIDGNGYPAIGRLLRLTSSIDSSTRGSAIDSRDLDTGALDIRLVDEHSNPADLVYAPRAPQTWGPLLGFVFASDRSFPSAGIESSLWITDVYQPYRYVRDRYFGGGFVPLQALALAGAGAGGLPTVAVLGTGADPTRDGVRLLTLTKESSPRFLRFDDAVIRIGLGKAFTAQDMFVIPDMNANGAPEFGVYEQETLGTRHRVRIYDGRTGDSLGIVRFSEQLQAIDVAVCPDLNGNGSPEVALLGKQTTDGGIRVLVKDAGTDEVVGAVSFPRE